ncbi:MAG: hypothetical protein JKX97_07575 [Candidatus Lindowbacteria bacterium]|nr:hypothetical protein [Candidatus Lindowbacteria bacterium]
MKIQFVKFALVLAVLFLVSACGPQVKVSPLGSLSGTPKEGTIKVYEKNDEIGRAYTPIANLEANDKSYGYSRTQLRGMLIKSAQSMGADGIVFGAFHKSTGTGPRISWTLIVPSKPKHTMTATAFVFTE